MNSEQIKQQIIDFIEKNGWKLHDEDCEGKYFGKENNIGIGIEENFIILYDDRGDYYNIPINEYSLNTLIGKLIKDRNIACDFKL